MSDFDLWTTASLDHEAAEHNARLSAVRIENAESFSFCASATNRNDFEHRLALVAGRLPEDVRDEVVEGWRNDYTAMLEVTAAESPFGKTASTYEVRTKLDEWDDKPWKPAGETIEEAEKAVGNLGDGPSTIVLLRNNFNNSVTVYEANSLGYASPKGTYESFYGVPPKQSSKTAASDVWSHYGDQKSWNRILSGQGQWDSDLELWVHVHEDDEPEYRYHWEVMDSTAGGSTNTIADGYLPTVEECRKAADAAADEYARGMGGGKLFASKTAGSFEEGIERIKSTTDPEVLRKMIQQNQQLRGNMAYDMPISDTSYYPTLDKLDAQDEAARDRLAELTASRLPFAREAATAVGSEYRRVDRGWVRIDQYTGPSGDGPESVHVVDDKDKSPLYLSGSNGYDALCNWCWFGYAHSTAAHEAEIAEKKTGSIVTFAEFPPKKDDKQGAPPAPAQQPAAPAQPGAEWQQKGEPQFGGTEGLTYWGFYAEVDGIAMEIGSPTAENDGQWKWFVGPADKPGTAYAQGDAGSVEEAKSAAQAAADQAKAAPPGDQAQDPNAAPPAGAQPPQPGQEQSPAAQPPADPNAAPPQAEGEQKPPEHKPEEKKPDPNCPPPKKAAYEGEEEAPEEEEGGQVNQTQQAQPQQDSGGGIGDIVQSVLPLLMAIRRTAGTPDPALQADEANGQQELAQDSQDIGEIAKTVLPMLLASTKKSALIHVPEATAFDVRGWVGPHAAKVTQRGPDVIVSLESRWLPQAIAILSEKYPTVYLDGNTFTTAERVAMRHLATTFEAGNPMSSPMPQPPSPPAVTTTPTTTKPRNGQSPPATINEGGAPPAPSMPMTPQPETPSAPGAPAEPDVPAPTGVT